MNSIIVATDRNGCIAKGAEIPWKCKEDLRHFMLTTRGKPVIMGRATFETLKQPLPGRTNIVITRQSDYAAPDGVIVCHDLESALETAEGCPGADEEIMITGGQQIYDLALQKRLVDRIYLSIIPVEVEGGDRFFHFEKYGPWGLKTEEDRETFMLYIFERAEIDPGEELESDSISDGN
ncbi:dihydrofolate reductase [Candidatus Sumerlaeota bacterium]|nr:dihydrofolate reductase [Candidatus Sumerlaeota bacterium]